jgi:hypothetical protein
MLMPIESIEFHSPESKPYGLTYGQWTVKWWKWALSVQKDRNPIVDTSGANASISNNDPNVFFLAGTLGGAEVERMCEVPPNRSILFPVINYEVNLTDDPEFSNDSELVAGVKQDIDDILYLETSVDGNEVKIFRISSDPPIFDLEDNFESTSGRESNSKRASSDGYWVFLKPLRKGEHELFFAGSCSAGTRNVKASYRLNVI